MNRSSTATRVRIYVGELDKPEGKHAGHEPLWEILLRTLRDNGASGATAFRGLAGFGMHQRIHMGRLADVIPDLPVLIEWIDDPTRVDRILPSITKLVKHGTITVEHVELARYAPDSDRLPNETEPDRYDPPT